jgi:hypothetical protein
LKVSGCGVGAANGAVINIMRQRTAVFAEKMKQAN